MKKHFLDAISLFCDVMFYGQQTFFKEMTSEKLKVLSFEQIDLLNLLSSQGPLSSTQIASFQGLHKSAISSRLKKLEQIGLIIFRKSPDDSRVKYAELTEEGMEEINKCQEMMLEYFGKLFGDFKEEDLTYFITMLGKVRERLLTQTPLQNDDRSEENK
ncbi:MarR family winged helix-turn-helix transcriptional regulator [Alkalicoccobacillus murimartini]|uniref:DNA-binding MarR family transcriptional regulator n=1 Tax=Alkalicoccobacillus murimartini TaxID=171685 RepID=A0ABT9YH70_9BACI|nr:MarR family transcriptional regulator [Alkalicoccobacillus murimartini]MDQ0206866.1 DNA-binding MarR family transcriptional regulator [Alkalicoccobacillus murimartini]